MSNPIWDELDKLTTKIDTEALVKEHLKACRLMIRGYWHGDERYEEIRFISLPRPELVSISLRTTVDESKSRSINMTFLLKGDTSSLNIPHDEDDEFGELSIVVNENLEFVDENWLIDVDSPFVVAKR